MVAYSQITDAAKRLLHVIEAAVVRRNDSNGESFALNVRRSRGETWETVARLPSKRALLDWIEEHGAIGEPFCSRGGRAFARGIESFQSSGKFT
jgi:hypothetical protein